MDTHKPGDLWRQVHTDEAMVVVSTGPVIVAEITDDEGTVRWEVDFTMWDRSLSLPGTSWHRVEVPTDAEVYAAMAEAGARRAPAAEAIVGALGCAESLPMIPVVLRAMALRGGA